jgi:hypothetical protein
VLATTLQRDVMRQFNALLNQPEFNALSAHSKKTAAAQQLWLAIAPEQIVPYCHASSLENKQLLLRADNNAVAAKIKLLMPSLLIQLEKQGSEVTAIQVKVQVKSSPQAKVKVAKTLSKTSAASIDVLAKKLQGTPLGASLAKLASRTR